jgi:hypothetical protein
MTQTIAFAQAEFSGHSKFHVETDCDMRPMETPNSRADASLPCHQFASLNLLT